MKLDYSAARARCNKATPGPWAVHRCDKDSGVINWQVQSEADPFEVIANVTDDEPKRARHDAALIAAMRTDLPAALDAIDVLAKFVRLIHATDQAAGMGWDIPADVAAILAKVPQ